MKVSDILLLSLLNGCYVTINMAHSKKIHDKKIFPPSKDTRKEKESMNNIKEIRIIGLGMFSYSVTKIYGIVRIIISRS